MGEEGGGDAPANVRDVFLFVNPTSGGNLASAYTKIGKEELDFDLPNIGKARIHIYNIKEGPPGQKPGFQKLKARIEAVKPERSNEFPVLCHVMVGGGDGTVMWAMTEIAAHGIDYDDLAVGVIPFGTGNDFSRTLGWGGKPPSNLVGQDNVYLKAAMGVWMTSEIVSFDLWQIQLETQSNGSFLFIDGKQKVLTDGMRKQHNIVEKEGGGLIMTKPMCNYYSIGYDGRTGLGFDKNRTKSALCNLRVYGWEGFKKALFRPAPKIQGVVDSIQVTLPGQDPNYLVVNKSKTDIQASSFVDNPVDLIFLNIPSYSKGCDVWAKSTMPAVTGPDKKKLEESLCKELLSEKQTVGDGKITVVTYSGAIGMSTDVMGGQVGCHSCVKRAKRLVQTEGETKIIFNEGDALQAKNGRTYMQIDGEFFIVDYPKEVIVKKLTNVKVLRNSKAKPAGCCVTDKNFIPDRQPVAQHSQV